MLSTFEVVTLEQTQELTDQTLQLNLSVSTILLK